MDRDTGRRIPQERMGPKSVWAPRAYGPPERRGGKIIDLDYAAAKAGHVGSALFAHDPVGVNGGPAEC